MNFQNFPFDLTGLDPSLLQQLGVLGSMPQLSNAPANAPATAPVAATRTSAGFTNPSGQLLPVGQLSQSSHSLSPINRFLNPGSAWGGNSGGMSPFNPYAARLASRFGGQQSMQSMSQIPSQPNRMFAQGLHGILGSAQ